MKYAKRIIYDQIVKVFLSKEEMRAYEQKLEKIGGGKKGPYARHLLLKDLGLKGSDNEQPHE